ncbi:unnamed protein product [Trichobilharzia regenti]|nr:unnamed protein product [Trichobilharzia regenti]
MNNNRLCSKPCHPVNNNNTSVYQSIPYNNCLNYSQHDFHLCITCSFLDQLRGIDSNMDNIREDLKEAQRDLDEIDKCCGLCAKQWDLMEYSKGFTVRDSRVGLIITNDAREDEMEQNLQQVSGMVTQLHSMATDMNQEITTHNKILDRIDQKVC